MAEWDGDVLSATRGRRKWNRQVNHQATAAMNASTPIISHMSIFVFSYYLMNTGVSGRLSPGWSAYAVLVGSVGFIAYFAFDWTASQRGAGTGPRTSSV